MAATITNVWSTEYITTNDLSFTLSGPSPTIGRMLVVVIDAALSNNKRIAMPVGWTSIFNVEYDTTYNFHQAAFWDIYDGTNPLLITSGGSTSSTWFATVYEITDAAISPVEAFGVDSGITSLGAVETDSPSIVTGADALVFAGCGHMGNTSSAALDGDLTQRYLFAGSDQEGGAGGSLVKASAGATGVYDNTINCDASPLENWHSYTFSLAPYDAAEEVIPSVVNQWQDEAGAADITINISAVPAGNILMVVVACYGDNTIVPSAGGWNTAVRADASGNDSDCAVFWREGDGATTAYTFGSSSPSAGDNWVVMALEIQDASVSTPIQVTEHTGAQSDTEPFESPAITTLNPNNLIIQGSAITGSFNIIFFGGSLLTEHADIIDSSDQVAGWVGSRTAATAGLYEKHTYYNENYAEAWSFSIAVEPAYRWSGFDHKYWF